MDFVHQRLAGIVEQVHKWPHWVWLLPVHIVLLAPATGCGLSLWNDRCLQQNTTAPLFMSPSQALVVAAVDGSVIFPLIVARSLTVYQRVMRHWIMLDLFSNCLITVYLFYVYSLASTCTFASSDDGPLPVDTTPFVLASILTIHWISYIGSFLEVLYFQSRQLKDRNGYRVYIGSLIGLSRTPMAQAPIQSPTYDAHDEADVA